MKQLYFFLLFVAFCSSLSAQKTNAPFDNIEDFSPFKQRPQAVRDRDGNVYQLDSLKQYDVEAQGDSILRFQKNYLYFEDSVTICQETDPFSVKRLWEHLYKYNGDGYVKYGEYFDRQGDRPRIRSQSYNTQTKDDYHTRINGVTYSIDSLTHFRYVTGTYHYYEDKVAHTESRSSESYSEFGQYMYDAYKDYRTYDASGRPLSVSFFSGPDSMSLHLYAEFLYTYSGDTTISVINDYVNDTLSYTSKGITVNNAADNTYENRSYSINNGQWVLRSLSIGERDNMGRIVKITAYSPSLFIPVSVSIWSYLCDKLLLGVETYAISSSGVMTRVRTSQYYYSSRLENPPQESAPILIFPNPVNEELVIDAGTRFIEGIRIFDTAGRLVDTQQAFGATIFHINRESVPCGLYAVSVQMSDSVKTQWVYFK